MRIKTQTYVPSASERREPTIYRLAPTDLSFLIDECQRCFYRKVVQRIPRPSPPFPSIFNALDRRQRDFFHGKPASAIEPTLPTGQIDCRVPKLSSVPLDLPYTPNKVQFHGSLDAVVRFRDGSFAVVDFKTSEPRELHLSLYERQLNAYAMMLEHPEPMRPHMAPVTSLGLLCIEPREMSSGSQGLVQLLSKTWVPIARDEAGFKKSLGIVCQTWLDPGSPPPANPHCAWCKGTFPQN